MSALDVFLIGMLEATAELAVLAGAVAATTLAINALRKWADR